jgi:hypothetical protein
MKLTFIVIAETTFCLRQEVQKDQLHSIGALANKPSFFSSDAASYSSDDEDWDPDLDYEDEAQFYSNAIEKLSLVT